MAVAGSILLAFYHRVRRRIGSIGIRVAVAVLCTCVGTAGYAVSFALLTLGAVVLAMLFYFTIGRSLKDGKRRPCCWAVVARRVGSVGCGLPNGNTYHSGLVSPNLSKYHFECSISACRSSEFNGMVRPSPASVLLSPTVVYADTRLAAILKRIKAER
jgi:hypothetical protein